MSERKPDRGVEMEVGGSGLLLAGILVLALCVVSFWLGRWSVGTQAGAGGPAPGGAEAGIGDGGDVAEDLTFFDTLEKAPELTAQGDERTSAPPKETPSAPAPSGPQRTASPPPPATGTGRYEVQVLASAERAIAESLVARLSARGYPAKLAIGEKDGKPIYRVRVVGYDDESSARQAAQSIEREEGLRTWVTQ